MIDQLKMYHHNSLYDHYTPYEQVEKKKYQLGEQLGIITYIVAFRVLNQQGYKIIAYLDC